MYNGVYVTEVFPDFEFLFEDFVSALNKKQPAPSSRVASLPALYFFDSLGIKLGSEDLEHPKPLYPDYRVSMYDNDNNPVCRKELNNTTE